MDSVIPFSTLFLVNKGPKSTENSLVLNAEAVTTLYMKINIGGSPLDPLLALECPQDCPLPFTRICIDKCT